MRLDKLLLTNGYGSRKNIKKIIKSKQVLLDNQVLLDAHYNIEPLVHSVSVAGKAITFSPHVYYMLNKPAGVVSARTDQRHQTVVDLITSDERVPELSPVGRLDRDTEGLLLLTNNGQLSYRLLMPENKVIKRYIVHVNAIVTIADQQAFAQGIVFHGGKKCQPANLKLLNQEQNSSVVALDIQEGKFHQVKKMFLAVGKKVTFLKRVAMGPIMLDPDLPVGQYRPLTYEELILLKPYF